jgi:hypothetical protein
MERIINEEQLRNWMAYNEVKSVTQAIEILSQPQYQWLGIVKWVWPTPSISAPSEGGEPWPWTTSWPEEGKE